MAATIRKDDIVEVITGDDRGTQAKVLRVDPVKGRITVEGVNMVHKHVRPSRENPQGGRLHVERSIDVSNVLPVNPRTKKATRVRFEVIDGQKKRIAVDDGKPLD